MEESTNGIQPEKIAVADKPQYPPGNPPPRSTGQTVGIVLLSVFGGIFATFGIAALILVYGAQLFVWSISPKQPFYNIDRALEQIDYPEGKAMDEQRTSTLLAPSYHRAQLSKEDALELKDRIVAYVESNKYASCRGPVEDRASCDIGKVNLVTGPDEETGMYYFEASDSSGGSH